jgi:hypothetical protein
VKITVIATGFRSEPRPYSHDSTTASAAIQQARQARWATPQPEPQITRRADAAYELQSENREAVETREAAAETEISPEDPAPAVESPPPPSPPSTRIWEAVQPPRPAASLEAPGMEPEHDELDVPTYLRKKNSDLG